MRDWDVVVLIIAVLIGVLGLFVGLMRLGMLTAETAKACIDAGNIWVDGLCLLP